MKLVQKLQEISLQGKSDTLSVTLTLSLCSKEMGYAHHLTDINIQVKFNENSSKGSGDMEQHQIQGYNP